MKTIYTICIEVEVGNEDELLCAARERYIEDNGNDEGAEDMLMSEDGSVNVEACLVTLADPGISYPGTSILESYVN
jgi:hypothetical protein